MTTPAYEQPIPRDTRNLADYRAKIWTPLEIESELDRLRDVVSQIVDYLVLVDRESVNAKRAYEVAKARGLVVAEGSSEKVRQAAVDSDEAIVALRETFETAAHVVRMTHERLREAYEAIDVVRSISASVRTSYGSTTSGGGT